jgi:hypothetical protein
LEEPGTDLVTVADVAAPDARKAMATIVVAGLEDGTKIKSVELVKGDVSHVSLGEHVLVWENSHGFVREMDSALPVETQHMGHSEVDWSRYQ